MPDALHPILANTPACFLQQRGNPAAAVASVFTGQLDDRFHQRVFIGSMHRLVALRGTPTVAVILDLATAFLLTEKLIELFGDLIRKLEHWALGINALDDCPRDSFPVSKTPLHCSAGWLGTIEKRKPL